MTRLIAAMCLAVACGGSGSSEVAGTVRGQAFTPTETISGASSTTAYILLANAASLCADATANKEPKNTESVLITLQDVNLANNATTAPSATGTYTLSGSAPHFAAVQFTTTDASCAGIAAKSAAGATGTVTLTTASAGQYAGSIDVVFDSTDHLTGNFSATACAGLPALFEGSTPPTCF